MSAVLEEFAGHAWYLVAVGIAGTVIFYSRFYVQWIASELKGRSVVPPIFWYQSVVGSFLLLIWAWIVQSPIGALSQSVNLVPYSRNLIHIWREQGTLSRRRRKVTHGLVAAVVLVALCVVVVVWWREYEQVQAGPAEDVRRTAFWLAVGLAGQALFAGRVLVQWIATERARKSVVPLAFWYMSIAASLLQIASFWQRGGGELLYAAGLFASLFVYARNLWLIHRGRDEAVVKG